MGMRYDGHAKVFKAFCDEKRLRILELLQDGEKCACVLTEILGMPQSSLAYHMKVLCDSGIVDCRQEGRWTHYRISGEGVMRAERILREITARVEVRTPAGARGCSAQRGS